MRRSGHQLAGPATIPGAASDSTQRPLRPEAISGHVLEAECAANLRGAVCRHPQMSLLSRGASYSLGASVQAHGCGWVDYHDLGMCCGPSRCMGGCWTTGSESWETTTPTL